MNCKVKMGNIFYEVIGEGFPIIILHSIGTDHRSMKGWLEPIFKRINGYQRVYIDLPAHGKSDIDINLKSTDEMLTNILDFIDTSFLGMEFSLIGSSFGGYLAQGILHFRQNLVKSICLLAPVLHLRERTLPEKVVIEKDGNLLSALDSDLRSAFETLFVNQNKESLDCFLSEIQPGRTLANIDFLTSDWREKGYFFSEEPFQGVSSLRQQALIILGKQDNICGYKDHNYLLNKFPSSTYVVLNKTGHMLQIEKRQVVQQIVEDWLCG